MFGKPQWFRETTQGFHLAPATWQGWAYAASWTAVLLLPALALVGQGKPLETLVWLAVAGGLGMWDVRDVRRQLTGSAPEAAEDEVLVIDENETESARFATRHYDLRFRNR